MGLFDGFKEDAAEHTDFRAALKAQLDEYELNYEEREETEADGSKEFFFYMRNELDNDETVSVVIDIQMYDMDDGTLKIKLYDIAYLDSDGDRSAVLSKINEWNDQYRYAKFFLDRDQDVVLDIDFPLDLHKGKFQPKNVMAMVAVGMNIVEGVFDELMELCTRGHSPRLGEDNKEN